MPDHLCREKMNKPQYPFRGTLPLHSADKYFTSYAYPLTCFIGQAGLSAKAAFFYSSELVPQRGAKYLLTHTC